MVNDPQGAAGGPPTPPPDWTPARSPRPAPPPASAARRRRRTAASRPGRRARSAPPTPPILPAGPPPWPPHAAARPGPPRPRPVARRLGPTRRPVAGPPAPAARPGSRRCPPAPSPAPAPAVGPGHPTHASWRWSLVSALLAAVVGASIVVVSSIAALRSTLVRRHRSWPAARPRHPVAAAQGPAVGGVDPDRRVEQHRRVRLGRLRRDHLRRRAGADQRPRRGLGHHDGRHAVGRSQRGGHARRQPARRRHRARSRSPTPAA